MNSKKLAKKQRKKNKMTIREYASLVVELENAGYSKEEIKDAVHELNHNGTNVFDLHPLTAALQISKVIDLWRIWP